MQNNKFPPVPISVQKRNYSMVSLIVGLVPYVIIFVFMYSIYVLFNQNITFVEAIEILQHYLGMTLEKPEVLIKEALFDGNIINIILIILSMVTVFSVTYIQTKLKSHLDKKYYYDVNALREVWKKENQVDTNWRLLSVLIFFAVLAVLYFLLFAL